jgi:NHL repeat-containing protein
MSTDLEERMQPRRLMTFPAALLTALAICPPARAVTAVSVDGHPDPVALTVGETVTIRWDVAKAGATVQYRLARDLAGAGKFDPADPVAITNAVTDGGSGDLDATPGKIAWLFTLDPGKPAGRYLLYLEDRGDNSVLASPVWTVAPKPQAQAISGRVVMGAGSSAPGSPPSEAIVWAYSDLSTPVASVNSRADGSYTLPVPPGSYLLFAEWFGNLRSQRQVVTVASGQPAGPIDHVLLVGQEVSGALRDDGGQPMPHATVTATPASGPAMTAQTLADGTYVLVLPEGRWQISARGMEKVVTVADQPLDGVDFPPSPAGPTPAAGTILTVAGNGLPGLGGEGGPAASARLDNPGGLAIDRAGNLYVTENIVNRIHKVDGATGILTSVAGSGISDTIRGLFPFGGNGSFSGDGGPATAAKLDTPQHVAVDGAGNLYISDLFNQRVRRVDAKTGIITTVVGSGPVGSSAGGFSGDGGPATSALLAGPQGIGFDAAGNLYVSDSRNNRIRKVSLDGIIRTVAGGGTDPATEGADAVSVALNRPREFAFDGQGNLFIWVAGLNRVLKMAPDAKLSFYAGNGTAGFSGDGGPATAAQLNAAFMGMAVDTAGNLFLADQNNNRVRKVSADGVITTVAGSGTMGNGKGGFSGDGGPATAAQLSVPNGVAIDAAGNLYISDGLNRRIRKVIGAAAPGALAPGG